MNRSFTHRRRARLLAVAPVYGVPAGLLAAFLVLAGVRGPEGRASMPGVPESGTASLASLVSSADAASMGPPAPVEARPAAPSEVSAPASASARSVPAKRAVRAHPIRPVPAGEAPSAPARLDAAIALIGPAVEDLGEPTDALVGPDLADLGVPQVGACVGMVVADGRPGIDAVNGCPLTMPMVNASAVHIEVRREQLDAVRKAVEREIVVRRARRLAGAI